MERTLLRRYLKQAERHVALGAQHLRRQRQIIAELQRTGADITDAIKLLDNMETSRALHITGRDRLRDQLVLAQRPV